MDISQIPESILREYFTLRPEANRHTDVNDYVINNDGSGVFHEITPATIENRALEVCFTESNHSSLVFVFDDFSPCDDDFYSIAAINGECGPWKLINITINLEEPEIIFNFLYNGIHTAQVDTLNNTVKHAVIQDIRITDWCCSFIVYNPHNNQYCFISNEEYDEIQFTKVTEIIDGRKNRHLTCEYTSDRHWNVIKYQNPDCPTETE